MSRRIFNSKKKEGGVGVGIDGNDWCGVRVCVLSMHWSCIWFLQQMIYDCDPQRLKGIHSSKNILCSKRKTCNGICDLLRLIFLTAEDPISSGTLILFCFCMSKINLILFYFIFVMEFFFKDLVITLWELYWFSFFLARKFGFLFVFTWQKFVESNSYYFLMPIHILIVRMLSHRLATKLRERRLVHLIKYLSLLEFNTSDISIKLVKKIKISDINV